MRMDYPGVSATTYYRPGESQRPPVTQTPFTATASGNASQTASGAVALTGHPGLWLVVCAPRPQRPSSSPTSTAPSPAPNPPLVYVGTFDGATAAFPISQWPAKLAQRPSPPSTSSVVE